MADEDNDFEGPIDALGGYIALAGMLPLGGTTLLFCLCLLDRGSIRSVVVIERIQSSDNSAADDQQLFVDSSPSAVRGGGGGCRGG